MRRLVFVFASSILLVFACGETRRPLGDDCIRSDDCLSGVCADRLCVAAPALVNGAAASPPDDTPRIPDADGSAPRDAGDGG
ncbi:MAG TPA: hypothetical protein VIF62_21520 [Labilithrix sp.]|jgi:hypothetical protein